MSAENARKLEQYGTLKKGIKRIVQHGKIPFRLGQVSFFAYPETCKVPHAGAFEQTYGKLSDVLVQPQLTFEDLKATLEEKLNKKVNYPTCLKLWRMKDTLANRQHASADKEAGFDNYWRNYSRHAIDAELIDNLG